MNKIEEIVRVLSNLKDQKLMKKFFESILTPNEINDISSRWELVKLLDQGCSQREIAKKLNLSLCKITRGSKELSKKHSAFKKCIDLLKELKKADNK